jgi:hypothetical protein
MSYWPQNLSAKNCGQCSNPSVALTGCKPGWELPGLGSGLSILSLGSQDHQFWEEENFPISQGQRRSRLWAGEPWHMSRGCGKQAVEPSVGATVICQQVGVRRLGVQRRAIQLRSRRVRSRLLHAASTHLHTLDSYTKPHTASESSNCPQGVENIVVFTACYFCHFFSFLKLFFSPKVSSQTHGGPHMTSTFWDALPPSCPGQKPPIGADCSNPAEPSRVHPPGDLGSALDRGEESL